MIPLTVVMLDVLGDRPSEMAFTERVVSENCVDRL
jgi:hypothetical protein